MRWWGRSLVWSVPHASRNAAGTCVSSKSAVGGPTDIWGIGPRAPRRRPWSPAGHGDDDARPPPGDRRGPRAGPGGRGGGASGPGRRRPGWGRIGGWGAHRQPARVAARVGVGGGACADARVLRRRGLGERYGHAGGRRSPAAVAGGDRRGGRRGLVGGGHRGGGRHRPARRARVRGPPGHPAVVVRRCLRAARRVRRPHRPGRCPAARGRGRGVPRRPRRARRRAVRARAAGVDRLAGVLAGLGHAVAGRRVVALPLGAGRRRGDHRRAAGRAGRRRRPGGRGDRGVRRSGRRGRLLAGPDRRRAGRAVQHDAADAVHRRRGPGAGRGADGRRRGPRPPGPPRVPALVTGRRRSGRRVRLAPDRPRRGGRRAGDRVGCRRTRPRAADRGVVGVPAALVGRGAGDDRAVGDAHRRGPHLARVGPAGMGPRRRPPGRRRRPGRGRRRLRRPLGTPHGRPGGPVRSPVPGVVVAAVARGVSCASRPCRRCGPRP
jgi:hypothetical protein